MVSNAELVDAIMNGKPTPPGYACVTAADIANQPKEIVGRNIRWVRLGYGIGPPHKNHHAVRELDQRGEA